MKYAAFKQNCNLLLVEPSIDGWQDINTLKLISSSSSSGILFSKVDTK